MGNLVYASSGIFQFHYASIFILFHLLIHIIVWQEVVLTEIFSNQT